MSFPVKHVANCFLQRDFEDGCATISPMKLQKLVYCLHGWHLAIEDAPAIEGNFEAWPYGPVEDSLYHIFKPFGNKPITAYASSWDGDEESSFVVAREGNQRFYKILDLVAEKYLPFTAIQLSTMTHQPGTPWDITRKRGESTIPDSLIKSHFRDLAGK